MRFRFRDTLNRLTKKTLINPQPVKNPQETPARHLIMNTPKYGLSRSERVRGRKLIDRLFSEGNSGFIFPLRYYYLVEAADKTESEKISMMVSVPKRHFKRAVKRNLLKRRVREAFRLNKHILSNTVPEGSRIHIAFIYGHNEIAEFRKIKSTVKRILYDIDKQTHSVSAGAAVSNPTPPSNT